MSLLYFIDGILQARIVALNSNFGHTFILTQFSPASAASDCLVETTHFSDYRSTEPSMSSVQKVRMRALKRSLNTYSMKQTDLYYFETIYTVLFHKINVSYCVSQHCKSRQAESACIATSQCIKVTTQCHSYAT